MMKKYFVSDILEIVKYVEVVRGPKNNYFQKVSDIGSATANSLIWIKSKNKQVEEIIKNTLAKFIICGPEIDINKLPPDKSVIIVSDPKLEFIRIIKKLFSAPQRYGTHKTAEIHPDAMIHENTYIGPNTYIGKDCKIDEGTIIHGNCYIYDNVIIGKNVKINANTVVGSEGYGYSRNEKGEFEHFPHIGGVIIEDNVDIGSNSSIDRGALGNTIIKYGAKIDNLVHIAHNVVVGKHTAVIANSMIGGSVVIGDYSWVAPSASIINQAQIGNKSTIGMAAVVTKDVPDNETWAGMPARPMEQFLKIQKGLKSL